MNLLSEHQAESLLDLTCQIQQIPGPTFHEGQRARFMQQRFEELGLADIHLDLTGNVLARLPASSSNPARPLVVSAHLDTVHPTSASLKLQRNHDRISGRAIGDNSLGLAALVSAAAWLMENHIHLAGDLWLAANVCEEGLGDLRGIRVLVDQFGSQPLAYIVLEGMGLGNILHRGLGVERYKIQVDTPGGHSWSDFGRPSAIHILCELVTRLSNLPLSTDPCTTLNVGVIQGGTSINTIAAQAWLELDLRSEDGDHLNNLVSEVYQMVSSLRRPQVTCSMKLIGKREAGSIPASHPLVRLACEVLDSLKIPSHLDIASTDANLPLSRGIPAICIGLTNGSGAHSSTEYISTGPVAQGMTQLLEIIQKSWKQLA